MATKLTSSNTVLVEVAPGELIDKLTILEIKSERIEDPAKLQNVRIELDVLSEARDKSLGISEALLQLTDQLKIVNEQLWDIEDRIRICENRNDFTDTFVELARAVYKTNDRRAALKREINELLGSRLVEEKDYEDYE
jgi:post-segregation antitoxin (ccd killing protein)